MLLRPLPVGEPLAGHATCVFNDFKWNVLFKRCEGHVAVQVMTENLTNKNSLGAIFSIRFNPETVSFAHFARDLE